MNAAKSIGQFSLVARVRSNKGGGCHHRLTRCLQQGSNWRSVIVIPISTSSSQAERGPTVVLLPAKSAGLKKASVALCHQVTTLDRAKLEKLIGMLAPSLIQDVDLGIKAALDLT